MRYVSDGSCRRRWGEEGHASTRGPIFRSRSGGHPPEAHYPKRVLDGWTTGRLKGNMAAQLWKVLWESTIKVTIIYMENSASMRPPAVKETKPDQTVECISLLPLSPPTPSLPSYFLFPPIRSRKWKWPRGQHRLLLPPWYSEVRNKKEVRTQNLLPSSEPFAKEKSLKLGMRLQHKLNWKICS